MKYYIELTLITNGELDLYAIWSKLYTQIHLALVSCKETDNTSVVGVSFPDYRYEEKKGVNFGGLGSKLRLFATNSADLERLQLGQWLSQLSDYVHISSIKPVPTEKVSGHLIVSRVRTKPSKENLARRYSRRHGVSETESLQRLSDYEQYVDDKYTPYVRINSLSGQKAFSLFIKQQGVATAQEGTYTCYGLSVDSTVPNF